MIPACVCTKLKHCTVLRRALLLLTAVVLLFALGVERAEFVHDYTELGSGSVTVLLADAVHGDAQDNEPFMPRMRAPARFVPVTAPPVAVPVPAPLAVFAPDLRPPIAV